MSRRRGRGCVRSMFRQLSLGIRGVLVCTLALVIVACSSTQTSSPPVTTIIPSCCTPVPISTVTIVSTPSIEPAPSIVALTETALACRFEHPPKLPPSQFAEWCNTGCPLRQDQYMVITSSMSAGRCDALFPLTDYKIIGIRFRFPTWWTVGIVGAEGTGLRFETDQGQKVFVGLMRAKISLEQADEATYSFESSGPIPLVAPEEQRISKEIQTVGDKESLVLVTADGDLFIKRYFVIHDNTLYTFRIDIPKLQYDNEETKILLLQVEEIISSMQFVR